MINRAVVALSTNSHFSSDMWHRSEIKACIDSSLNSECFITAMRKSILSLKNLLHLHVKFHITKVCKTTIFFIQKSR